MNYLKDIVIQCEEKKVDKKFIKYYMPNHISPYLEINEENINLLDLENVKENLVGVNPYFRNEKIFWDFMSPEIDNFKGLKSMLFNILSHMIAGTDYFYIQRVSDFEKKLIKKAILKAEYGEEVKNIFIILSKKDQKTIIEELYKLYKLGINMERFITILNEFFPGNISYDYKEDVNNLSVYIPQSKNEENKSKFEILKTLFIPINIRVYVYWEHHFAVIGIDEMSKLDNCKIF